MESKIAEALNNLKYLGNIKYIITSIDTILEYILDLRKRINDLEKQNIQLITLDDDDEEEEESSDEEWD